VFGPFCSDESYFRQSSISDASQKRQENFAGRPFIAIKALDLSHNNLTDDQCEILSDVLKWPLNCLVKLELRSSWITDKGVSYLVSGLKHNKRIKMLNLAGNHSITQHGWAQFVPLLGDLANIHTTRGSNHTLCILYRRYPNAKYNDMEAPDILKQLLDINMDAYRLDEQLDAGLTAESIARAAKITAFHLSYCYLKKGNGADPFAECAVPDLLGWIGKFNRGPFGTYGLMAFQHILQNNLWILQTDIISVHRPTKIQRLPDAVFSP
jgi:hypothetical protein